MPVAGKDIREDERTSCRIKATIRYQGREARATVLDLTEAGARVYLGADIGVRIGQDISIATEELGYLTGVVTWLKAPYAGVRLSPSSNTSAKVFSYFRR